MENEEEKQIPEETEKEPVTEPEETEKEPEHDAVAPGGKCSKCGWEFGKSIEPHAVYFGPSRNEPSAAPEPKKFIGKEPDPKACQPIAPQAKCPKCGWSGADPETRDNPHPVLI